METTSLVEAILLAKRWTKLNKAGIPTRNRHLPLNTYSFVHVTFFKKKVAQQDNLCLNFCAGDDTNIQMWGEAMYFSFRHQSLFALNANFTDIKFFTPISVVLNLRPSTECV